MLPRTYTLQQEKPLQWEACALQLESNPSSMELEKGQHAVMKTQWSQK